MWCDGGHIAVCACTLYWVLLTGAFHRIPDSTGISFTPAHHVDPMTLVRSSLANDARLTIGLHPFWSAFFCVSHGRASSLRQYWLQRHFVTESEFHNRGRNQ